MQHVRKDIGTSIRKSVRNISNVLLNELHEEELFKQSPPVDDCPICMIRLPSLTPERAYMACCGKEICNGCIYAVQMRAARKKKGDSLCPFCRVLTSDEDDVTIERYEKRAELNDPKSICSLGCFYSESKFGLPQNYNKALELWQKAAAELGDATAYYNIATAYLRGNGVVADEKKAKHYFELAAIRGDPEARYNLGCIEYRAGSMDRAFKHWMLSSEGGCPNSLDSIKQLYGYGRATKGDYARALSLYQAYLVEVKSDQRDIAAALKRLEE